MPDMHCDDVTTLLNLMSAQLCPIQVPGLTPGTLDNLLNDTSSAIELAGTWKAVMNADSDNSWEDPMRRCVVLLLSYRAFDRLRANNYGSLRASLAQIRTLSGRPLTVDGTACEIASRTSEALFLEGRRIPSEHLGFLMLSVATNLMTFALTNCRQKDNPNFARRWYGIRGVCQLMLAVQLESTTKERQLDLFLTAASGLEEAFRLGNRGSSSVAYLLDALLHVLEEDNSDATISRIEAVIAALNNDEKQSRSVLALLGRYYFNRSFTPGEDAQVQLQKAYTSLTDAISYPPELSFDNAFVRLIRGQVLVRLAIATEDDHPTTSSRYLDDGISDLQAAFEYSPSQYGRQSSLPSALIGRADVRARAGQYAAARADLQYLLSHEELSKPNPDLASQAEFKFILTDLREAIDSEDKQHLKELLGKVVARPECASNGAVVVAAAAKHLFDGHLSSDEAALISSVIAMLDSIDVSRFTDQAALRRHFSLKAGLQFAYGRAWDSDYLLLAVDSYSAAIDADDSPPPPELLSLYGDCSLQLAKACIAANEETHQTMELLEQAAQSILAAVRSSEEVPGSVSDSFSLVVGYSKAAEAFLRLGQLTDSKEDYRSAVEQFEKARSLGNTSAELLGLQADACYRLYRITKQQELLNQAIALKQSARDAGGNARENLSLSAKLSLMRWDHSNNPSDLADAFRLIAEAHELSPLWPWPPFQLAEALESLSENVLHDVLVILQARKPVLHLLKILHEGGRDSLIHLGCQLVIKNSEFSRKILGGRQKVYVLEDPHRLLSESYVFKPTQATDAKRDREVILAFSEFIRKSKLEGIRLPIPLAIIPATDGKVVYVMRRARGFHIGRLALLARRDSLAPPTSPHFQ